MFFAKIITVSSEDQALIAKAVHEAEARLALMEEANRLIAYWGPLRAAPALLKLGLQEACIGELLSRPAGVSLGYSAQELAQVEASIRRLSALIVTVTADGDVQRLAFNGGTPCEYSAPRELVSPVAQRTELRRKLIVNCNLWLNRKVQ